MFSRETQLLAYLPFCKPAAFVSNLLEWCCSISIMSTVAVISVACFCVPNCPFVDCCVHYLLKYELLANADAMYGYSSPDPRFCTLVHLRCMIGNVIYWPAVPLSLSCLRLPCHEIATLLQWQMLLILIDSLDHRKVSASNPFEVSQPDSNGRFLPSIVVRSQYRFVEWWPI